MVEITINNKKIKVEKGSTILDAAKLANIHIPTLCHLDLHDMNMVNREANCRVCMVEVGDWGKLEPACATLVKEGMSVRTDTLKVIQSRRTMVELLLSNHPTDCLICEKNGECELQDLAAVTGIKNIRYEGERIDYPIDDSSLSIIRDPNKCILCKRCETICNEVQTVGTLTDIGRGFETVIGTAFNNPMFQTNCTFCGQCLSVCPTGALHEVNNVDKVYAALNSKKTVIVQTAPAVRVALGEEFGMEPGSLVTGKMVSGLRALGFDYVFDTDFAADVTVMEEAAEFVHRFKNNGKLPILTSCCPSWVKFIEHNFADLFDIPSTCKSPHEMFGSLVKTYFAGKKLIDPKDIVVVSIMPCVAKKYESARPELSIGENVSDVDIVLTTRELASMLKDFSISFADLPDDDFDNPLGESSGAGVIFGASGGVLEATLRTAHHLITGEELEDIEFHNLSELKGIKEASVTIEGREIKVAVASGLGNARELLHNIRKGKKSYDVIEIMACPAGCISGGGQPFIHGDVSIIEKRKKALRTEDRNKSIRKSHLNPSVIQIYDEFLGEPYGEKAHKLLHTTLVEREKYEI
ncbi:MAG: 2Fe-2S iron-sulfur cluster binding domain-containing protein [Tissierellia bacterium]|nr:2Fe-2S iron-sulfur cluster binding domain-containing protein [Tissierellia bacterium]